MEVVQGSPNTLIALGGVFVAGIGTLALVFLMVQSLIEEWFAAAEITDE